MKWIIRECRKSDRIACPWLIGKFTETEPEFLYVPANDYQKELTTGPLSCANFPRFPIYTIQGDSYVTFHVL